MSQLGLASAINATRSELLVRIADTPDLISEAFKLRHQVYCLERGYEASLNNMEKDEYDCQSHHVVLCKRSSGEVIGTARLILPVASKRQTSFPMQQVCPPNTFRGLPFRGMAEVSRFAISKERRDLSVAATSLSRLALVQGLVQLSQDIDVTHWCAMMERSLLRLLRASAIHFTPLGEPVEYHGLRQPAYCEVKTMLDRMAYEQPEIWRFIAADTEAMAAQPRQKQAA